MALLGVPQGSVWIHVKLTYVCNLMFFQDVPPGAYATAQFKLTPPWAGRHQLSAKFTSKEMRDIDGFLSFTVAMPGATRNGRN